MKFSEAIREGCKVTEPTRGSMFRFQDGKISACALGAGVIGLGYIPIANSIGLVRDKDGMRESAYDVAGSIIGNIKGVVMGKNDVEQMSREEIADWLEGEGY